AIGIRRLTDELQLPLPEVAEQRIRIGIAIHVGEQSTTKRLLLFAKQFVDQGFLAVEVAIDGAGADPRQRGNFRNGHTVDASLGEHVQGGTQDRFALAGAGGFLGRGMLVHGWRYYIPGEARAPSGSVRGAALRCGSSGKAEMQMLVPPMLLPSVNSVNYTQEVSGLSSA